MTGTTSRPPLTEVKRRLRGGERRYDCQLVYAARHVVVARFEVVERPWRGEPRLGPEFDGTLHSYGVFWARRPYLCYHMVRPADGVEAATRFDVVRDVRLDASEAGGAVSYTDLLLDRWSLPGDVPRGWWEDEDDVAAARRAGLLTYEDERHLARARRVLERADRRIVREVRALLRTCGVLT